MFETSLNLNEGIEDKLRTALVKAVVKLSKGKTVISKIEQIHCLWHYLAKCVTLKPKLTWYNSLTEQMAKSQRQGEL